MLLICIPCHAIPGHAMSLTCQRELWPSALMTVLYETTSGTMLFSLACRSRRTAASASRSLSQAEMAVLYDT